MRNQYCHIIIYTQARMIIVVEAWKAKDISTSWTTNVWRFCTRRRCFQNIRWKANLIDIYENVSYVPKFRSTPGVSDHISKDRRWQLAMSYRLYFNSIFDELHYETALLLVNMVVVLNYFRETPFSRTKLLTFEHDRPCNYKRFKNAPDETRTCNLSLVSRARYRFIYRVPMKAKNILWHIRCVSVLRKLWLVFTLNWLNSAL